MAKYFQDNMWFLSDVAGLDLSPLMCVACVTKHNQQQASCAHSWALR